MPDLILAAQSLEDMAILLGLADAYPFPAEAKAGRDTRDPARPQKDAAEEALYKLIRRFWKAQQARIEEHIRYHVPFDRAAKSDPLIERLLDADFWGGENALLRAWLIDFLMQSAQESVGANDAWTRQRFALQFDPTLTNADAAKWARQYAGQLARGVNQTTQDSIRQSVANWIETPGATMKDLMDALPFSESRAAIVAVTEVTAAYSEGERLYTQDLQDRYPTLKIVRIWNTNNDERVCPLCEPLNGKAIPVDGGWGANGDNDPEGVQGPPLHPRDRCWTSRDVITD